MANARPSANFDRIALTELDAISGNLLSNDSEPDGQPLFLRFVGGVRIDAKQGADQITLIEGTYGTFSFKPDGSFTYALNPDVADILTPGEMVIEQLPYKVSDGLGGTDVSMLRLEISGALPGLELKTIDFEDLAPGGGVPDGYQGFDWGDGWTIVTDPDGAHVAAPMQMTDAISLESGEDFFLTDIVVNSPGAGNSLTVAGFDDGVAKFAASITFGAEPAFLDLQWEDIDTLQITRSASAYIDSMTVAVPAV